MTKISGVLYNSNGKRSRTDDDCRITKRMKISHDFKNFVISSNNGKNKQNGKLCNNSTLNHDSTNNYSESDEKFMKLIHEDNSNTKSYKSMSCLKTTNNEVIVNNCLEANKKLSINKTNTTSVSKIISNHINTYNNFSMCEKNKQSYFNNNDPVRKYVSSSENNIECIIIGSDEEIEKKNSSIKISYNNITFEYSKENWPSVLKMMQDPISGVKIFESILTQKVAGQLVNNSVLGKQRYMIEKLKKRERLWMERYKQLQIQLSEIKTEVLEDKKRFSKLKHYKRTIHTSVGIQANFDKDLKTLAEVSTNNISSEKNPLSNLKLCNSSDSLDIVNNSEKNVGHEQVIIKPLKMYDSVLINKSIPPLTHISHTNILESTSQFNILKPKLIQNTDRSTTLENQNLNFESSNLEDNNNIETNIVTTDLQIHEQKASSYSSNKDAQEEPFCTTENITSMLNNDVKNVKETYYKLKPVPLAIPLPVAVTLSTPTKNDSIIISSLNKPSHVSPEKLCCQLPPMPIITLRITKNYGHPGVILLWDLDSSQITSKIISYEIYSYELLENAKKPKQWMRIGEVNALPLPMTCTLNLTVKVNVTTFQFEQKISMAILGRLANQNVL
ncbi:probable serine/threonine-protein kinase DDB_G0283337 isoform X2 [Daktulosphaira vitifoliae]|uniref:probable serine/threonine-protein kinase DDB_G0283337 isoform X2 n=1 Tax=Daktulosphaira vitifoliae TaxID=58002 RepID=UPI0021AA9A54|nr:probable serine/threonine-protein kinase DDB_G0283337 isoform X2 [Daktulosphaira vitifoliae]